jgi:hypothetical protein
MSASSATSVTLEVGNRRALSAAAGAGRVLFTARRVVFDKWNPCACGAPRRVVSERAIIAGEGPQQWVVVSERCSADC